MKEFFKAKRTIAIILALLLIFSGSLFLIGKSAFAVTDTKTIKKTSSNQQATVVIDCPNITKIVSCTVDNGVVESSMVSENTATVICNGGTVKSGTDYVYNVTIVYEVSVSTINIKVKYPKLHEIDASHYTWTEDYETNANESPTVDRADLPDDDYTGLWPKEFSVSVSGSGWEGKTPVITISDGDMDNIKSPVNIESVQNSYSAKYYTITASCNGMVRTISVNVKYLNVNTTSIAHWDRKDFIVTAVGLKDDSSSKVMIDGESGAAMNLSILERAVEAPQGTITPAGYKTLDDLIAKSKLIGKSYSFYGYWTINCWNEYSTGVKQNEKTYSLRANDPYTPYQTTQSGPNSINSFTGWSDTTKANFKSFDPYTMNYAGKANGVLNVKCVAEDGSTPIAGYDTTPIPVPFDPGSITPYTTTAPSIPSYTFIDGTLTDMKNGAVTNTNSSRTINYANDNNTATVVWRYKKIADNLPPVPIIDLPTTCVAGDTVRLRGTRSYDSDGTIVAYDWHIQGSVSDMEGKPSGNITFPNVGEFIVALDVTDDDGAVGTTSVRIKVTPRPPIARYTYTGKLKENRKVTFDGSSSIVGTFPIDWTKTIWNVVAVSGGVNTNADARFLQPIAGQISISGIFRKEGKYQVPLTIYDTGSMSSSYSQEITILPDLNPLAAGTVPATVNRVPTDGNQATINVQNRCSSPDGDPIFIYTLKTRDANNNGTFSDDIAEGSADGIHFYSTGLTEAEAIKMNFRTMATMNPATISFKTDKVGKVQIRLISVEQIPAAETIPSLLTGTEQRMDMMNAGVLVCDVVNIPPTATLSVSNKKQLDMVVVTDYSGTARTDLENKIDVLKYSLSGQNYDLQVKYPDKSGDYPPGTFYVKNLNFDDKNELPYSTQNCWLSGGIGVGGSAALTGTANATVNSESNITFTVPDSAGPVKISGYASGNVGGQLFVDGISIPLSTTLSYFERVITPGAHTITAKGIYTSTPGYWSGRKDDKVWHDGVLIYGSFVLDNIKVEASTTKWVGTVKYVTEDPSAIQIENSGMQMKLKKDGTVWAKGYPECGQLYTPRGPYNSVDATLWVQQPGAPANIDRIFCKSSAMFALTKDGTLYCTGQPFFWTYYSWYEGIVWPSYSVYPKDFTGWRVLTYGVADVKISAPSGTEGQSYAVLFKNGTVGVYVDYNGSAAAGVSNVGPFDLPNTENSAMQSTRYCTSGIQIVPGLNGITKIDMYKRLLVAYNGTTKKVYGIGDNTGGVLGWNTPMRNEGWTNYGPYERTVKELPALAGLDIIDIDCNGHRVLTRDCKIYTFGGSYVGTYPYTERISQIDGSMRQNILGSYLNTAGNNTFTDPYTYVPVYGARATEVSSLSYRDAAQKILLYAANGEGASYWDGFGKHYPLLETNDGLRNYLSAHKFDSYIVANPSTYTFFDVLFGKQQYSIKDLFSLSVANYYNGGQIDQAFNDIRARYNNVQSPNKIYYILGEDSLTYTKGYADYENDPKQAERCKDDHDSAYFENGNGQEPNSGTWQSSLPENLSKIGKHTLTYQVQDNPLNIPAFMPYWLWSTGTNQVEVYVHRRPIANFVVSGSAENTYEVSLLNNADGTANLPVSLSGSCTAQGGIGLNGSSAYRVLEGNYYTYSPGELTTTFTVPASAVGAKIRYYLKGYGYSVTLDGAEISPSGTYMANLTYVETPVSTGTHTFKVSATHYTRHKKDDDIDVYGNFGLDDLTLSYTSWYKNVTYMNKSYDLDHDSLSNRGIIAEEWKWRYPWESNWRDGRPSRVEMNIPYFVSLRVKDMENTWSYPAIRYVDYPTVLTYPVAQYTIRQNPIELSEKLNLTDTSYTEKGGLTHWHWNVYRLDGNGRLSGKVQEGMYTTHNNGTGALAGYDQNVQTDYSGLGEGTYRIFLRVRNTDGLWSDGEGDGNIDLHACFYQDLVVKNSMMLMNFRISMIRDLGLEGFYRSAGGSKGRYRDIDMDVNQMGIDGNTFVGKEGVHEKFKGLTKGYIFEFKIDSIGLNGAEDSVRILPSFYTISGAGVRNPTAVDLYWKDSQGRFFKAGEGGHLKWKSIELKGSDRRSLGENKAEWRGSYLIPGSAFAVPKGTSSEEAKALFFSYSYIKEDILVSFQIDGCQKGVSKFNYNLCQWQLERKNKKAPYIVGDVIRYDWRSNCLFHVKTRRIF